MHLPPLVAYLLWIPASLWCFRRYPLRIAILIHFTAGWAILPAANYRYSDVEFPYWITGTNLPSDYFLTKATVLGITAILGLFAALFIFIDRKATHHPALDRIRYFRPRLIDIPVLIWCAVPLLSGIANDGQFLAGIAGSAYNILAWGVPYLLGRIYFSDAPSLELAARALVLAGLAYVPICLVEFAAGPRLYHLIYGYLPFQWVGAARTIGYRPIGLLEIGNQLGIWMSTAALTAVWYWRARPNTRFFPRILGSRTPASIAAGISAKWAAISLIAVTLLCQSTGSILLLLVLLPFVAQPRALQRSLSGRRNLTRILALALVAAIVLFAILHMANVISLRSLAAANPVIHSIAEFFFHIGKGSFGWRLARDEGQSATTLQEPILGTGQWNWWQKNGERPWDLWMLAFGLYGAMGFFALLALQLLPVIRAVFFDPVRGTLIRGNPYPSEPATPDPTRSGLATASTPALQTALAAVILMTAIDNLLNSSMILSLLLIIGGMTTWTPPLPDRLRKVKKAGTVIPPAARKTA